MKENELLCSYYEEVLEPFFPNSGKKSAYMGMLDGSTIDNFEIEIIPDRTLAFFKDSKFDIKPGKQIVHFTSLQSAISIIKEQKVRLYDLESLDDLNEVEHVNKAISLFDKHNNYKEIFYVFSASDYSKIEANAVAEFNMWRLYGKQGEGIGLVFKYDDDPDKVYDFYMSEVYYKNIPILENCLTHHKDFCAKHSCRVTGLENILVPLSLFYKDPIYMVENEVRIIKKWPQFQNRVNAIGYDYKKRKKVKYYEMPINSNPGGAYPNLKLEKIIVGYKYEKEDLDAINDIFKSTGQLYGNGFEIMQTKLKDAYFNKID